MKRKILFRGKHPDGFWLYGDLATCWRNAGIPELAWCYILPTVDVVNAAVGTCSEYNRVIELTVSQYTGFKDINDVDIYEGDIIEGTDYSDRLYRGIVYCEPTGAWILAHDNGHNIDGKFDQPFTLLDYTEFMHPKVVGNVFDDTYEETGLNLDAGIK